MRVGIVTAGRSSLVMGLESAELRMLDALRRNRNGTELEVRAVGGRSARSYAKRIGARWYPSRPGRAPRRAWGGVDLVHLAGLTVPPPQSRPFVATFYDLSPLHFPDEGELPAWMGDVAERAELLFCPSRFTASELTAHLGVPPERIRVTSAASGLAVSSDTPALSAHELEALGLTRPFVLRLGGYTRRKNVSLLLEAWPEVRRRTDAMLVLVGPPQQARAEQLTAAPSLEGVSVFDYVPAELLPRLLRSAAALVSTSTYEGFGLPPLEALAAGTPVVCTHSGFAEEVCGDAALLVEAEAEAVARALTQVLTDGELAAGLAAAGPRRAAGFTWDGAAQVVLDGYRAVASTST